MPFTLSRPTPLVLAALVGLVFGRVVGFGFAYDDGWTLVDNTWLTHPLGEILRSLGSGAALLLHVPDATRPAMVLFEALERRVFGLAPWGYHLDSLLLYALACALAGQLALVLSRRGRVAWDATLFFALAPIHAEVLAAINYREDLLAAVGVLGALLLACTPAHEPRRHAVGAGALFALALFGKESAVALLPLAAVIVHAVPWARASLRANRTTVLTLAGVLVAWLVWRVPLALHGDDIPLAPARPLGQLLLRTARFEVLAVRYALIPFGGTPDHWREPDASFGWVVPCLSLFAGAYVLARGQKTRLPALGVGIALAAPLACSPLFRPVNELADRYFFLGVLGGGLVWGWVLRHAAVALGGGRSRLLLGSLWLLLLVPARRAVDVWRDERSLWTATVALTPASPRAWAALSRVHRLAHEQGPADVALARALAADPDYVPARVTELYNDLVFGRLEVAREHLQALDERRLGDGGGIGKARRCVALGDATLAAQCIER